MGPKEIPVLKEYQGQEISTKELINTLGLSTYLIKKLTEEGALIKVSRGLYKVKELDKNKDNITSGKCEKDNNVFKSFCEAINKEKYEMAYDLLYVSKLNNPDNHDYDNHNRIYFILLEEILKSMKIKKDSSNLNLYEFDETSNSSYFNLYVSFRKSVMMKDYENAKKYIDEFAACEKSKKGTNNISTIMFQKIIDKIFLIRHNNSMIQQVYKEISFPEKDADYYEIKKKLLELRSYHNNQNALQLNALIIDLVDTIIEFLENDDIVIKRMTNEGIPEYYNYIKAFIYYMKHKDYIRALQYVDKCPEIKTSYYFKLASVLLNNLKILNLERSIKLLPKDDIVIPVIEDEATAKFYFGKFLKAIYNHDYDQALYEIEQQLKFIKRDDKNNRKNSYRIYFLLKKLKEVKDGVLLGNEKFAYLDIDGAIINLDKALKNEDYEKANEFLEQISVNDYGSLNLRIYKEIIEEIIKQNKINLKKVLDEEETAKKEAEELAERELLSKIKNLKLDYKTLYELVKNKHFDEAFTLIKREEQNGYDINAVIKEKIMEETPKVKEDFKEEIEKKADEGKTDEIKESSIDSLTLNIDTIYDLVYDRKYDEVITLINHQKEDVRDIRYANNVYHLILQYNSLLNGIIPKGRENKIEFNNDYLRIYYTALSNRDYELALEYLDKCIENSRTHDSKYELELYKLVLTDIVDLYLEVKEQNEKDEKRKEDYEKIAQLSRELASIAKKVNLTNEDVHKIIELLEEKITIACFYNEPSDKDKIVLNIAKMALLSMEGKLSKDAFANIKELMIESSGNDFADALKYGDINTVYNLITTKEWKSLNTNLGNTNLYLIKKLSIIIINETARKNDKVTEKSTELENAKKDTFDIFTDEEKNVHEHIGLLQELTSLIKHREYNKALYLIIKSKVSLDDMGIIGDLLFIKDSILKEGDSLFDEYINYLDNGALDNAKKFLIEYEGLLERNGMKRNVNYLFKDIEILRIDLKEPNFKEKEKLYNHSLKSYSNKKYDDAIKTINEYIEMDENINYKGYLLKAQIEETLGLIDLAKKDYEKVLSYVAEPTSYRALSYMAFNEENYELAAYYIEAFNEIKPYEEPDLLKVSVTCYQKLEENEKALKYKEYFQLLS